MQSTVPRHNRPLFQKGEVEKGPIPSPFPETERMLEGSGGAHPLVLSLHWTRREPLNVSELKPAGIMNLKFPLDP